MKKIPIFCLALLMSVALLAQQPKRIYITLDVSGSMTGDKYSLANYTTQMLVTLCDREDEVHFIVYGTDKVLSRERNPLQVIQKPMNALNFGTNGNSQFDDIIAFNALYRPSPGRQDWLFIVGDGMWATGIDIYENDRNTLQSTVEGGSLNVCYLQTGYKLSENNDFTEFAESLDVIDIRKSSIDPKTISDGCVHFSRKILGFSEVPLKVNRPDTKSISILSEMPLKAFYLVYQDEVAPERLPGIRSITADGRKLEATLKGTPTTLPTRSNAQTVRLSGNVWLVQANRPVAAGSEIEVAFDREIDPANVSIYPIVEDIEFGATTLTAQGGRLKKIDGRTYSICRDESKALVRVELNDSAQENLPDPLLRRTKVVVKANGKDYQARYRDGGFECEIELVDEETQYYAECDCPGYFKRVTSITKIVKGTCEEEEKEDEEKRAPVLNIGSFTFEELTDGPIKFTLNDVASNELLDPTLFDLSVEVENGFFFEKPSLSIEEGSVIVIDVRPKGKWCECLLPETLNLELLASPKSAAYDEYGKNYKKNVQPIHVDLVKNRSFWSRCKWVPIVFAALLLFVIYLLALLRKRRFKKNAQVTPIYYNRHGDEVDDGAGLRLRNRGIAAWFARWFLPGREKRRLTFNDPECSVTFWASESPEIVDIPKDSIVPTMIFDNYDPDSDFNPSEPVKLGPGGQIQINDAVGRRKGYLVFTPNSEQDGTFYRIILVVLIVLSILAMAGLLYFMILSIL